MKEKQSVVTVKAKNREEAITLLTETLYHIVIPTPPGSTEEINMVVRSKPYDDLEGDEA